MKITFSSCFIVIKSYVYSRYKRLRSRDLLEAQLPKERVNLPSLQGLPLPGLQLEMVMRKVSLKLLSTTKFEVVTCIITETYYKTIR